MPVASPVEIRSLRIAIDYTAAVNQNAGIGRFVRNLVGALLELDTTNSYLLLHAAPNPGANLSLPRGQNVSRRPLRLTFCPRGRDRLAPGLGAACNSRKLLVV